MRNDDSTPSREQLDQAISDRLGRLRSLPVDTSRLERALQADIPWPRREASAAQGGRRLLSLGWWFQPLRAVAASFVLLAIVAAILVASSGGPAVASPSQMAQMHDDLVTGRTPVMQVDSIEAANRMLSGQWPNGPTVPNAPQGHVMACCMKSVKDKKVACVLLKSEGEPITLTVANATDMRLPNSPTVVRNGVTYHVQAVEKLNMVMAERHGRWVCLIARLPAERLIELASELKF
jgi:hypothetical protein